MAKKYYKRRSLRGGFLDSLGQTLGNLGSNISSGASSFWDKTKKMTGMDSNASTSTSSTSSYFPSTPSTPPVTSSSYTPTTTSVTPSYSYGGKRTRRSRKMKKGGSPLTLTARVDQPIYNMAPRANQPINTLASEAASFSGVTAKADYVGGKRKSRSSRSKKLGRSSRRSTRKTSRR
jgi:hypothetical protein